MAWATLTEVGDYPSTVTVTAAHLTLAQDIIEVFSGTTEDASDAGNISERNLRLLNRATIYQAIFVANHPELLEVHDVENLSADGVSGTYRTANAQLLAPMASRCINRLSWRQRPLHARRRAAVETAAEYGSRDSAARDDARVWTPL